MSFGRSVLAHAGVALLAMAITSYMAILTGSTTFTTVAGAKLEVRRTNPAQFQRGMAN